MKTDLAIPPPKSDEPVHGGNVDQIARIHGLNPEEIIDFSANINPSGPSLRVIGRLAEFSADAEMIARYPESDCCSLRQALATYTGLSSECVVVANGSAALIDIVLRALRPRRCLLPVPAFSEYGRALNAANCDYESFLLDPAKDFALDVNAFLAALQDANCDFCIVTNPHNPSGSFIGREPLLNLCRKAADLDVAVLLDEAFIEYVPEASISEAISTLTNLVVLRSITKFYALAGMRVGYALTCPEIADALRRQTPSWPVSTPAILAAIEAVSDFDYAAKTRASCDVERDWFSQTLAHLGVQVFPSAANFLLVCLPAGSPKVSLIRERLILEHRILIRDCSSYEGLPAESYMRLAIRDREDNSTLIQALKEVLA